MKTYFAIIFVIMCLGIFANAHVDSDDYVLIGQPYHNSRYIKNGRLIFDYHHENLVDQIDPYHRLHSNRRRFNADGFVHRRNARQFMDFRMGLI